MSSASSSDSDHNNVQHYYISQRGVWRRSTLLIDQDGNAFDISLESEWRRVATRKLAEGLWTNVHTVECQEGKVLGKAAENEQPVAAERLTDPAVSI